MAEHLLAIDDVEEDFEMILKWAIEFKRLWKRSDEVAQNFMPLDTLAIGSIYEKPCLLYTSPSPRDQRGSRMPSSA